MTELPKFFLLTGELGRTLPKILPPNLMWSQSLPPAPPTYLFGSTPWVVNTVRLVASQFSKINRPIFFWFQTVCSCKTQVTVEKNLSPSLRYDLVQLEETHALQHHWKKSKVSSTNLWDKLQFVNSVKRLVFDLTKIPFLKRLIGISRLIVEVLNDQNLLQNRIWLIGFELCPVLFRWSFLRMSWSCSVVWKNGPP